MAKPGLTFAGFLYDDAGDAINGATINITITVYWRYIII